MISPLWMGRYQGKKDIMLMTASQEAKFIVIEVYP
jgi:hypothetical protein